MTKGQIHLTITQKRRLQAALGITIVRGFLVIFLGLALFFQPDKSRPMLANFMGFFYLVSGIVSLRWGTAVRPVRRLALLAGSIGVLAGLVTLGRHLFFNFAEENLVLTILGAIMFLTGILHILGGFRTDDLSRSVTWGSFILGIFEIVLGTLLIMTTEGINTTVYLLASLWAFVGGFIILADAWRLRIKLQEMTELQVVEEAPTVDDDPSARTPNEEISH